MVESQLRPNKGGELFDGGVKRVHRWTLRQNENLGTAGHYMCSRASQSGPRPEYSPERYPLPRVTLLGPTDFKIPRKHPLTPPASRCRCATPMWALCAGLLRVIVAEGPYTQGSCLIFSTIFCGYSEGLRFRRPLPCEPPKRGKARDRAASLSMPCHALPTPSPNIGGAACVGSGPELSYSTFVGGPS